MSRRTAEYNGFNVNVVEGRVQDAGAEYDGKFSLILCNPPYERGGFENCVYERAICRKEITVTLPEIIAAAAKNLNSAAGWQWSTAPTDWRKCFIPLRRTGWNPKECSL